LQRLQNSAPLRFTSKVTEWILGSSQVKPEDDDRRGVGAPSHPLPCQGSPPKQFQRPALTVNAGLLLIVWNTTQ